MKPIEKGKVANEVIFEFLNELEYETLVIEMIQSFGMAVGKTVFETCVYIGRFMQRAIDLKKEVKRIYRKEVKLNICNDSRAKDNNITQALVDRFAPDTRNKGKGIKSDKGWFYGFKADIWQAYAVGITFLDLENNK